MPLETTLFKAHVAKFTMSMILKLSNPKIRKYKDMYWIKIKYYQKQSQPNYPQG